MTRGRQAGPASRRRKADLTCRRVWRKSAHRATQKSARRARAGASRTGRKAPAGRFVFVCTLKRKDRSRHRSVQARPNDAPPRVVLNKVGLPNRPEIPLKDFGEALGLTPCLSIAFDAKLFGQASNNGQMISEVGPKSKQAENLETLARMISRRESGEEAPARPVSLLDRLLKR